MKLIQGDVVLIKVEGLPSNAIKQKFTKKILQMSEVTGHHHHFKPKAKVDLYQDPNFVSTSKTITPNIGKYILVYEEEGLYHGKGFDSNPSVKGTGDHKMLSVPPGIYKIDIVREYDYDKMEVARVVD